MIQRHPPIRHRFVRGLTRVLVVGAAWALAPVTAAAQVSVDALELALPLRGSAGSPATQTFNVTNNGETGTPVTIAAQDWDRSETGENRYAPLGALDTSCGAKVSFFPAVLYLEPKESATIRVRLESAQPLDRGCYTILFVETPKPPPSAGAVGLQYSVRYGVKVYVEPDAPRAGEIVDADVHAAGTAPASDSQAVSLTFLNTGSRQIVTRGTLEIRRADNSVVQALPIAEFPTLPQAKHRLTVGLPKLPRGSYVVLALLDYGGTEIAAGQVVVEVP